MSRSRFVVVTSVFVALVSSACMRRVNGLWVEPRARGTQRLWFAKNGFFIETPASWKPVPPTGPLTRATIQRKTDDGFTITCSFQFLTDPDYEGLSPEELLDRYVTPSVLESAPADETLSGLHVESSRRVFVEGHPANYLIYTAEGSLKGVTAAIKMSAVAVPYRSMIIASYCGSLVVDFPALEKEFASIQFSLRRAKERQ